MGSDNVTKTVLDLDNSEFVSKLKESLGLLKEFGDGQNLSELIESMKTAAEIMGVIGVAALAMKAAIDLTTEAEHINQITTSFEALAKSAGQSADVLKNQLTEAAKGLVDEASLLQSANKEIVQMGVNAGKLPQIMELARKATVLFGGDLLSNFENMSRAMASGNARMLRRYGLIVDATKAEDAYAKSLGVSREYLDDSGKKLAVMNAALEQGEEKFKNVNEDSLKTTNALKSMGATFKDLADIAVLAWGRIAGPGVSKVVQNIADWFRQLKVSATEAWGGAAEKAASHKEYLIQNIESLEKMVALDKQNGLDQTQQGKFYIQQLAQQKAELEGIYKAQERSAVIEREKAELEKKSGGGGQGGVDTEKLLKDRQKFEQEIAKIHKDRVEADIQEETKAENAENDIHQKSLAIQTQADAKVAQTRKQFKDLGLSQSKQEAQAVEDIQKKAAMDIMKNDQQVDAARIKALQNYEAQTKKTSAGIVAGFNLQGEKARQNFTNMASAGEKAFTVIGSNATAAFQSLGDGSKNAADALKGFFFGAIGDIAEQQGEIMLLMGIWPPNPIAIAAGGALIALGAAIKSMGNSSGGSAVSGGGGSGGFSAASADSSGGTTGGPGAPTPQAAEKKAVTIAIQGNYFETDQTRTRLMEMIREAGDYTDFQLKQIGQP